MSNDPRVLCLIPARGGSKGVPRKNIRELAGKPLIAYTIETALECGDLFHQVVVSTDDEEIAAISCQYGAEVPFMRPDHLALDTAPTLPVIQHAISFVEDKAGFELDWIFLLQPTAPFRSSADIRNAMTLATQTKADSVVSVVQVFAEHPVLMKRIENDRLVPFCVPEPEGTRRQDYEPKAYMRNGAIYIATRNIVMNQNSIYGDSVQPYVMPQERSYNIDSMRDFLLAETVLSHPDSPASEG